jgi:hypothetical protein
MNNFNDQIFGVLGEEVEDSHAIASSNFQMSKVRGQLVSPLLHVS